MTPVLNRLNLKNIRLISFLYDHTPEILPVTCLIASFNIPKTISSLQMCNLLGMHQRLWITCHKVKKMINVIIRFSVSVLGKYLYSSLHRKLFFVLNAFKSKHRCLTALTILYTRYFRDSGCHIQKSPVFRKSDCSFRSSDSQ